MLRYVTIGTTDLARARRFYDAVLAPLGAVLRVEAPRELGYATAGDVVTPFWVTLPWNGDPATAGNGTMPAFHAPDAAAVRAFHDAALANGGSDEGAPGLRPYGPGFYAAYVRDPDGNKLSAVTILPA
jgi:catechol 2,3-dioxygenase-like lactoylglutathione lyase family enzyme